MDPILGTRESLSDFTFWRECIIHIRYVPLSGSHWSYMGNASSSKMFPMNKAGSLSWVRPSVVLLWLWNLWETLRLEYFGTCGSFVVRGWDYNPSSAQYLRLTLKLFYQAYIYCVVQKREMRGRGEGCKATGENNGKLYSQSNSYSFLQYSCQTPSPFISL